MLYKGVAILANIVFILHNGRQNNTILVMKNKTNRTNFKSSYARLARLFKKSRDKWKDKAIERHKEIRALEVKIRDLEESRARWKAQAKSQNRQQVPNKESSSKTPDKNKETEEADLNHELINIEKDERLVPHNHRYSVLMIRLAIELQLKHISLRGTCCVLALFSWALLESSPSFPTVQNWACRYGLYLLNQPKEYRTDWVFVLDHTVGQGKNKCLVVLGITEENLARVNYCPSHKDMQVLWLEVTGLGTGEVLSDSLEELSKQVGVPTQIVADHGSDVVKGIRLFQEEHPGTIYTYDISHRMATFLKQELSKDTRWNSYFSLCSSCIPKYQQTNMAFICPPRQRTKARFMQTHHQVRWGQNMLRYYDRDDFSLIDTHYSLDQPLLETLSEQFGQTETKELSSLLGNPFSDQVKFHQALAECLGDRVNQIPDIFWEQANAGKRRFLEGYEWLLDYREDLEHYEQLLDWSHFVQKHLKTNGLSEASQQTIEASMSAIEFEDPRMFRLGQKTLKYLQQETETLSEGQVGLASSDIIESVFGTYKSYTDKGPLKEIGKLVLMIPVFVAGTCKEALTAAMETIRSSDVDEWLKKNCGTSMLAKRRQAFAL